MWQRRIGWLLLGLAGSLALLPGAVVGMVRLWWFLTDRERFETTSFVVYHHWWAWVLIMLMLLAGVFLIGRAQRKK